MQMRFILVFVRYMGLPLWPSWQYKCFGWGLMDGLSPTIPIVDAGIYKRGSIPHLQPPTA